MLASRRCGPPSRVAGQRRASFGPILPRTAAELVPALTPRSRRIVVGPSWSSRRPVPAATASEATLTLWMERCAPSTGSSVPASPLLYGLSTSPSGSLTKGRATWPGGYVPEPGFTLQPQYLPSLRGPSGRSCPAGRRAGAGPSARPASGAAGFRESPARSAEPSGCHLLV